MQQFSASHTIAFDYSCDDVKKEIPAPAFYASYEEKNLFTSSEKCSILRGVELQLMNGAVADVVTSL